MRNRLIRVVSVLLAVIFSLSALPALCAFAIDEVSEGGQTPAVTEETEEPGDGTDTPDTPVEPETPSTPAPVYEPTEPANSSVENVAVAGYKYSKRDSYFYVDQNKAWQGNYGYNKAYDLVAPYLLLEYDYVRVHFTCEGKDWMVQLWKGQYGLMFYGCEAGVYNKTASDEEDTAFTTYSKAKDDDRPFIQTTMYHDPLHSGVYKRELTTPYEQTWWSTGFKRGHLTIEEPANELRQTGIITFRTEELATLFANGLAECGFGKSADKSNLATDTYCIEGNNVYYSWQDISQAENTMDIKIAIGTYIFLHFAAFMAAALLIMGSLAALGMLMIIL